MRRWLLVLLVTVFVGLCLVATGLPLRGSTSNAAPESAEHENEPIVHRGATTCGVERWTVKAGLDRDARLVNTSHLVPTNVSKMRSLPAPSSPPVRSRVKPVETTVWSEAALLIRVKMEQDSDFHLVLSDTGGRTMIGEIPYPSCVGSSSPFPSHTSRARVSALDARKEWLHVIWLAKYSPELNQKEHERRLRTRDTRGHLAADLRTFVDEIVKGLHQLGGTRCDSVDRVPNWFIEGRRVQPTGRPCGRPVGSRDSYQRGHSSRSLPADT